MATFRIIQESLTNAHKHGSAGTADMHVTYSAEGIAIAIVNPANVPEARIAGSVGYGLGLVGMRERVAAIGGNVHAGPEGPNAFGVHAFIPAPVGVEDQP